MARYRRRSTRGYLGAKRNADRHLPCGNSVVADGAQQFAYTYTAKQACTVKSIKLDIGARGANLIMPYALVVVREGYDANLLNYPVVQGDMYNPTMDVLISGVITDQGNEDHKSNAIGRKLKTGDRLCLLVANSTAAAITCAFEMPFTVLT
jgi:hypothetical protein